MRSMVDRIVVDRTVRNSGSCDLGLGGVEEICARRLASLRRLDYFFPMRRVTDSLNVHRP